MASDRADLHSLGLVAARAMGRPYDVRYHPAGTPDNRCQIYKYLTIKTADYKRNYSTNKERNAETHIPQAWPFTERHIVTKEETYQRDLLCLIVMHSDSDICPRMQW